LQKYEKKTKQKFTLDARAKTSLKNKRYEVTFKTFSVREFLQRLIIFASASVGVRCFVPVGSVLCKVAQFL